jgi:peptidoglycan/xylan/chitin deacetylase (PgdA/CDA1 family)
VAVLKPAIIRGGLESLYFTGAYNFLKPFVGGVGAILSLHHVRPARKGRFQPNRTLEVTPRFFTRVVRYLRRSKLDIVTLGEMHRRLVEGDFSRRFVCLTFDDGYRDTLQVAYPVLKKEDVPFAVYVATSFPDQLGELWWLVLEAAIARSKSIAITIDGRNRTFECRTVAEKRALYDELYGWLRSRPTEAEVRHTIRTLADFYGVDIPGFCKELCMNWEEIAELAADPLVTIGAHTVNHPMLAKLPDKTARSEMDLSRSVIEAALTKRPEHMAFPLGDRFAAGPREFKMAAELGFKTAVTSRPGVLFPEHGDRLTALPRISLDGQYQRLRYVRVLLSGSATAVWNGFRRSEAA